ncbi:hypothetical protein DFH09DRAFT_1287553 [Mycena vulgaris]|nr:hypothetical protein DFH09DRAFT_1287553 [Mycena vulgaris]
MCGLTAATLTAPKSKPKTLRPISVDSTVTTKAFEDIEGTSIRFERRRQWDPEVIGVVVERRLAIRTTHCPPGISSSASPGSFIAVPRTSSARLPSRVHDKREISTCGTRQRRAVQNIYNQLACARSSRAAYSSHPRPGELRVFSDGERILGKNKPYPCTLLRNVRLRSLPSSGAVDTEIALGTTVLDCLGSFSNQRVPPYAAGRSPSPQHECHHSVWPGRTPSWLIAPIAPGEAVSAGPVGESHRAATLGYAHLQIARARGNALPGNSRRARASGDEMYCASEKELELAGVGVMPAGYHSTLLIAPFIAGSDGDLKAHTKWVVFSGCKMQGGEGLRPATMSVGNEAAVGVQLRSRATRTRGSKSEVASVMIAKSIVHVRAHGHVMRGDAELEDERVHEALLEDGGGGGYGRDRRGRAAARGKEGGREGGTENRTHHDDGFTPLAILFPLCDAAMLAPASAPIVHFDEVGLREPAHQGGEAGTAGRASATVLGAGSML